MKKYMAFLGCSYSNWDDGNCFYYSYPALVSKEFNNYNIVDMSIPGSSNDTLFLRLKYYEDNNKIKFDKIIVQITHLPRTFIMFKENIDFNLDNILLDFSNKDNYYYTDTGWNINIMDSIGISSLSKGNSKNRVTRLEKFFGEPRELLDGVFSRDFSSWKYTWNLIEQIELLNFKYGRENVLFFSWHTPDNALYTTYLCKLTNYLGSIQEAFGNEKFFNLGVDKCPHYNDLGHLEIFNWLKPELSKFVG